MGIILGDHAFGFLIGVVSFLITFFYAIRFFRLPDREWKDKEKNKRSSQPVNRKGIRKVMIPKCTEFKPLLSSGQHKTYVNHMEEVMDMAGVRR